MCIPTNGAIRGGGGPIINDISGSSKTVLALQLHTQNVLIEQCGMSQIFPNIVDEDFIGATCLTTFTTASSAGTITVPTCLFAIGDDDLVELAETFSLSAAIINSNAQPAQFSSGGDSASVTINSDDGRLFEPNKLTV